MAITSRWTRAAGPLLLLLLAVCALFGRSQGQRPYPLTGSDGPLPTNSTNLTIPHNNVNVTVLLERIVTLFENDNSYEVRAAFERPPILTCAYRKY